MPNLLPILVVGLILTGCELISNPSLKDTIPPSEVANLSLTAGDGQLTLRWTEPPDRDFVSVQISRNGSVSSTVSKGVTASTFMGLTNGTTYTFLVQSQDDSGNKSQGRGISGTPEALVIVTFDSNGGTPVPSISVALGRPFTAPTDPTKPGYDFAGWFQDSGLTQPWAFGSNTTNVQATLFAKWTVKSLVSLYAETMARYTFDDGTAKDSSGNSRDGTNHGASPVVDRRGLSGKAMGFNGTSNYIDLPTASGFNAGSANYALSLWFRPGDLTKNYQTLVNTYPHRSLNLAYNYDTTTINKVAFFASYPSFSGWAILRKTGAEPGYQLGVWYQLVLVKKSNVFSLFVNGVNVLTISGGAQFSGFDLPVWLRLGDLSDVQHEYLRGSIDDISLWPRALSDSEVADLYAVEKT